MSKVIRVDAEVYSLLLKAKADLEAATGQPRSFSDAIAEGVPVVEFSDGVLSRRMDELWKAVAACF